MDFFLHIVVSTAVAYKFSQNGNSQRAFILGGIVPDLDVFAAWIPQLLPNLYFLQHRGLFHTVFLAPIIIGILIYSSKFFEKINFIQRLNEPLQTITTDLNHRSIFWGVFGVFLHLTMDIISYNGVPLLYPLTDQRITLNLISIFDPLVSVLSGLFVLRLVYNNIIKSGDYSFTHFQKSAKMITTIFVILLAAYSALQVNTVMTHSPISTKPEIIPIFRWVYTEDQNTISIRLVNQFTQAIIQTYTYQTLTYNQSKWDVTIIHSIVNQAKDDIKYQGFKFELESESYLAIDVSLNQQKNRWEVSFLDTFQDAQFRFYGFHGGVLMESDITIYLDLG